MNDLVELKNGMITVSSKAVADKFKKPHRTVLRAITSLECSEEFREHNFARSSYFSPQNKKLSCFDMTRDGFAFLCMGFTGKRAAKWKEEYINAFNQMEAELSNSNSLMEQINRTIKVLEDDKAIASSCASGLAHWRKIKKKHVAEVERLISSAQLSLGFDFNEG